MAYLSPSKCCLFGNQHTFALLGAMPVDKGWLMSELGLEVPQTPLAWHISFSIHGQEANLRGRLAWWWLTLLLVGCFVRWGVQSSLYLGRRARWSLRSEPSRSYKVGLHGHKQNNPSQKCSAAQNTACVLLLVGFSYKSVFLCLCFCQPLPQVPQEQIRRIVLRCLLGMSCTSALSDFRDKRPP